MALTDEELQKMEVTLKSAFKRAEYLFSHSYPTPEQVIAITSAAQALLAVECEIDKRAEFKTTPLQNKLEKKQGI